MILCPHQKCRWWSDPSKFGRKCYYEPMCWRGQLDLMLSLVRLRMEAKK